jgi:hypothetical protein
MKAENITLGCDPELLVQSTNQTIVAVPAWEVVSAKKGDTPLPISSNTSIHADGVALEFNTTPVPIRHFADRALNSFRDTATWVKSTGEVMGKKLRAIASVPEITDFSKEVLANPLANLDGCAVDYCAYNEDPCRPRERQPINSSSMRYLGGHIHVGYDTSIIPPWAMARFFDLFVYAPIVTSDKQPNRRPIYGLAGLYRPKPYGMEYRTPSSYWLTHGSIARTIQKNIQEIFLGFEKAPKDMNRFFNSFDWTKVKEFVDRPLHTDSDFEKFYSEVVMQAAKGLSLEIHLV